MIRVDSVTLRTDDLPLWKVKGFDRIQKDRADGGRSVLYEARTPAFGVNMVRVFGEAGEESRIEFQLSSKALLSDYPRLIGLDTVERVAEQVTSTGLVAVDPDYLLRANVHKVDLTNDLKLTDEPAGYIEAVRSLRSNPRFRFDDLGSTVQFRTYAKKDYQRVIFYDKQADLLKAENRPFLEVVGSGVYNRFMHVVRVEQNCTSLRAIRKAIGVKDYTKGGEPTLNDVLMAPTTPNLDLFRRIRKAGNVQEFFDDVESFPGRWSDYEKLNGRIRILERANYDLPTVFEAIGRKVKGNISRYKRTYRGVFDYVQARADVDLHALTHERLDEIEQALALAA